MRVKASVMLTLLLPVHAYAVDETISETLPANEEFLEFLAEYTTVDGQWIDPIELETIEATSSLKMEGKDYE